MTKLNEILIPTSPKTYPSIYSKEELEQAITFLIRRLQAAGVSIGDVVTILSEGYPFMTAEARLSLQIIEEFCDAN